MNRMRSFEVYSLKQSWF